MAERYVKLRKEQADADAPLEDIRPGELNLPVQVPQLEVRRCSECKQELPESYSPPADEPWTSGIFHCMQDTKACWTGLFCPCVLFGRNVSRMRSEIPWTSPCMCHALCIEGGITLGIATALFHGIVIDPRTSFLIGEGLFFTWWMCSIYSGLFRQSLQKKYHLKNSPCDPCAVHCCLHWCAICQEHREMNNRLSDSSAVSPLTLVNPPPVQEMNAHQVREPSDAAIGGAHQSEHTDLEMQPL